MKCEQCDKHITAKDFKYVYRDPDYYEWEVEIVCTECGYTEEFEG